MFSSFLLTLVRGFAYCCSCMAKQYTHDDLMKLIRSRVEAASQKSVAAQLGVSRSFLNDVLMGRRELTDRVAEALGYECGGKVYFRKSAA